jgi:hypothetical protein
VGLQQDEGLREKVVVLARGQEGVDGVHPQDPLKDFVQFQLISHMRAAVRLSLAPGVHKWKVTKR